MNRKRRDTIEESNLKISQSPNFCLYQFELDHKNKFFFKKIFRLYWEREKKKNPHAWLQNVWSQQPTHTNLYYCFVVRSSSPLQRQNRFCSFFFGTAWDWKHSGQCRFCSFFFGFWLLTFASGGNHIILEKPLLYLLQKSFLP